MAVSAPAPTTSDVAVNSTPAAASRRAQNSSAPADGTASCNRWIMPAPAVPGAAPANSNHVRIDPGDPASSPKYRW